jgi:hypothetical protein
MPSTGSVSLQVQYLFENIVCIADVQSSMDCRNFLLTHNGFFLKFLLATLNPPTLLKHIHCGGSAGKRFHKHQQLASYRISADKLPNHPDNRKHSYRIFGRKMTCSFQKVQEQ